MTFFDIKVVEFDIKIASCKIMHKENVCTYRADRVDFWKNLDGDWRTIP